MAEPDLNPGLGLLRPHPKPSSILGSCPRQGMALRGPVLKWAWGMTWGPVLPRVWLWETCPWGCGFGRAWPGGRDCVAHSPSWRGSFRPVADGQGSGQCEEGAMSGGAREVPDSVQEPAPGCLAFWMVPAQGTLIWQKVPVRGGQGEPWLRLHGGLNPRPWGGTALGWA